jgi:hypothetical protein
MLPLGPAPKRLTPGYGQAPCLPAILSTTGGACSGLDPYTRLHIHTIKLVWGIHTAYVTLKFMAVIHTAYATLKMSGPKGVITIKSD